MRVPIVIMRVPIVIIRESVRRVIPRLLHRRPRPLGGAVACAPRRGKASSEDGGGPCGPGGRQRACRRPLSAQSRRPKPRSARSEILKGPVRLRGNQVSDLTTSGEGRCRRQATTDEGNRGARWLGMFNRRRVVLASRHGARYSAIHTPAFRAPTARASRSSGDLHLARCPQAAMRWRQVSKVGSLGEL
jgi:hypothetical protein